jgi:hypothetical protein
VLQRLPWELMPYKIGDPGKADNPVFKSRGHRVMRGRPDQRGEVPAGTLAPLPIRVLVVVCDKSEELRAEDEVDAIYAGLCQQPGVWQVEVLREPSWDALADTLRVFPPQILHFIAHAGNTEPSTFKVRRPSSVADADLDYWDLTVGEIEELLVDQDSLPLLFVLNACHTATMVPAERFRRLGTKGVIATQAEINSAEAVCFTQAFYRHLADKGSLENAMWHARVEMRRRRQFDYHDWGIPVLTVYGAPEDVIRHDLPELGRTANELQSDRYPQVNMLVDRTAKHRMVWGRADGQPDKHLRPNKHLVVISGRRETGKTQLIHSCMLTWELRGSHGILVDMGEVPAKILPGRRILGAREALLHICGELSKEPGFTGTENSTGRLLRDLEDMLGGIDPHTSSGDPGPCDEACGKLLEVLRVTADKRPLLLVLDQLENIVEYDLHRTISDKFLWPIARGLVGHVDVIAIISEECLKDGRLGSLPMKGEWEARVDRIEVDFFKSRDAMPLGREYGARRGWVADDRWQSLLKENRRMQDSAWSPVELLKIAAAYEMIRGT